jgi:alpha-methylacyl-CoA racemase
MTGWGQDGPLAAAAGHDINYIALAGALHPIGDPGAPPPPPLNLVGDFGGGGMLLAFGVAAALVERARSGRGQVLDVAMLDGVATLLASLCQLDAQGQWSHERGTNWLDGAAPWYGTYRTADDRFVTVGALEGKFYALLLGRLGLDAVDWPQWDRSRWPALRAVLEERFAARTLAEWRDELEGTDACFAPVLRSDEAAEHPHVAARGTFERHDGVLQPAPSPRFSRTPGAVQGRPPLPGEHTAEVLAELQVVPDPHPLEHP